MKTAMGTEKVRVWISETLGTKIVTRLFRGLALGALLVAATGLYFSINQGEAGSPSGAYRSEVYPGFMQTEVWLPGDTYPMAAYSSKGARAESENLPQFLQTEVWLPGDTYPVSASSKATTKAQSEDLPGFLQTEVWLPGDTYPIADYSGKVAKAESEDLPGFLQTEVWLPGDIYPVFGR